MRLPRWATPEVMEQLVALDEAHALQGRTEADILEIHYDRAFFPAKVKVLPRYVISLTTGSGGA